MDLFEFYVLGNILLGAVTYLVVINFGALSFFQSHETTNAIAKKIEYGAFVVICLFWGLSIGAYLAGLSLALQKDLCGKHNANAFNYFLNFKNKSIEVKINAS